MAIVVSNKFHVFLNLSFLLLLCFFFTTHLNPSKSIHLSSPHTSEKDGCRGLGSLKDYKTKCSYLKTHNPCVSQGYIDYLHIFYCILGKYPLLGYALLALWLLVLFYLLGNTASQYFCSSLESLSRVLRLSPTIAGVTLLSLGNGAPDVFASIVSFAGSGSGEVGLSSVLGGAFFVSSVVVGIVSISIDARSICIHGPSFVRDVCFFILALSSLLVILIVGRINIWGAMSFVSLYFVYVFVVSTTHFCREKQEELAEPLLDSIDVENSNSIEKPLGNGHGEGVLNDLPFRSSAFAYYFGWFLYLIEMPLYLPRRLTIPDVSEERWSKPFAVASVIFAPLLLATLWNSQKEETGSIESLSIYLFGGLVGMILGITALGSTEKSNPPRKFMFPWLAGGFLMSVIWAYIIAGELVSLLVSLGYIIGISPSVLGLTVLAWGNSLGDLITNLAMAMNGGQDGAQIAISGCYAGPAFNTLVGLGVSILLSSWAVHPSPFVISQDPSLFEILGFLIGGLLWALVILPRRGMKLDKVLGVGLLSIYLCFLSLKLSESLGLVQLSIYFHL